MRVEKTTLIWVSKVISQENFAGTVPSKWRQMMMAQFTSFNSYRPHRYMFKRISLRHSRNVYGMKVQLYRHGPSPEESCWCLGKRGNKVAQCNTLPLVYFSRSTSHSNATDIPTRHILSSSPGNEVVDFLESRAAGHTGGIPQHDSDTLGQEYKQSSDLKTQPPVSTLEL